MFENYSKCRFFDFSILAISNNFYPFNSDLTGNTVWTQASGFQKLAKLTIFGIFDELLPTVAYVNENHENAVSIGESFSSFSGR